MYKKNLMLLALLVTWVGFTGCNSQSPEAIFVDEMQLELLQGSGQPPRRLDYWDISSDGSDIYGAVYGFVCTVESEGVPLAGIRVDCYIEHSDPFVGNRDIWGERAPNGERYGFVVPLPAEDGVWDYDEGVARARTSERGQCIFLIGLGDPGTGGTSADPGYAWPGGNQDLVFTFVDLTFVVQKRGPDIVSDGYAYFFRAQYQDFFEPHGGIYGNSVSALGEWGGMFLMAEGSTVSGDGITMTVSQMVDLGEEKEPRMRSYRYPEFEKGAVETMIVDANDVDPNLPSSGDDWAYIAGVWDQMVHDSYGWYWKYPAEIVPLWMADPNGEDAVELVSAAFPYAFFCEVVVDKVADMIAYEHTVLVVGVDSVGTVVSRMPVKMFAYSINGTSVYFVSDWILPMEFFEEQGIYTDKWGYTVVAVHVPEGGHLEIAVDDFYGDFNFDNVVDNKDMALFSSVWNPLWNGDPNFCYGSVSDPNFCYDIVCDPNFCNNTVYDASYDLKYDYNRDGYTGMVDLVGFLGNWLEIRP